MIILFTTIRINLKNYKCIFLTILHWTHAIRATLYMDKTTYCSLITTYCSLTTSRLITCIPNLTTSWFVHTTKYQVNLNNIACATFKTPRNFPLNKVLKQMPIGTKRKSCTWSYCFSVEFVTNNNRQRCLHYYLKSGAWESNLIAIEINCSGMVSIKNQITLDNCPIIKNFIILLNIVINKHRIK